MLAVLLPLGRQLWNSRNHTGAKDVTQQEKPEKHTFWNKGKLVGQKSPDFMQKIWSIRMRLQAIGNRRVLSLINLAIDRTVHFLGIEIDDPLEMLERIDV